MGIIVFSNQPSKTQWYSATEKLMEPNISMQSSNPLSWIFHVILSTLLCVSGTCGQSRDQRPWTRTIHQRQRLRPGSQPHPTSNYVKWFLNHNSDVILVWAVLHRHVLGETCSASLNSAQLSPLRHSLQRLMCEGSGESSRNMAATVFSPQ